MMVVGCKTVGQGTGVCSPSEVVGYTAGDGSLLEVFQKAPLEVWNDTFCWKRVVDKCHQE